MGKLSRDKGARAEREIVALHTEIGVKAEKVPLSGATKYQGGVDVDVYPWGDDREPLVCEVKARASGTGFRVLEGMLGDADVLFLRRDRQKPLVVLPWSTWQRLLKR
jgi:Holliday junction resolvase